MELEFDKEIDAILRRARPSRGVLVGDDPPKKHLDADSISAFAENALPQKAKLAYMEHFADCERCRKQLSQAMMLNTQADVQTAVVSAPVAETAIPWYTRLFKTRNLAVAMGAIVLTFSGVLAYLVLQNTRNSQNATVSQVTSEEEKRGDPFFGGEAAANSNTAMPGASPANPAGPANLPAANTASNSSAPFMADSGTVGRLDANASKSAPVDDKNVPGREVQARPAESKSDAGASPPPAPPSVVTTDRLAGERDEKKLAAERQKDESKDLELAKRKYNEDARSRDLPAAASKVGPSRSGPVQNQSNQANNRAFDMPVTRIISGKTFNNRDGAWYDSTYRNQATSNYRRGTDAYIKLDRGLRNIADTLGGTVVIIWKAKAYRIQ